MVLLLKNPLANTGNSRDVGSFPGLGRSPKEGNGNLLQYSYLENSMDRGAWWVIVHGVAISQTRLSMHGAWGKCGAQVGVLLRRDAWVFGFVLYIERALKSTQRCKHSTLTWSTSFYMDLLLLLEIFFLPLSQASPFFKAQLKSCFLGTSLVVQWLRIYLSM